MSTDQDGASDRDSDEIRYQFDPNSSEETSASNDGEDSSSTPSRSRKSHMSAGLASKASTAKKSSNSKNAAARGSKGGSRGKPRKIIGMKRKHQSTGGYENSKKAKWNQSVACKGDHPLSICREILFNLMEHEYAMPFLQAVDAKALGIDDYYDRIKDPMDLGLVLCKLERGEYKNAQQLRQDVSKVWFNCLTYNGCDHEIYQQAAELARVFDERFKADIPAPQFMGVEEFPHGAEWCGAPLLVYWDGDHAWFEAKIAAYIGETEGGHQYTIQYPDDQQTEDVTLPDINVAILALDPAAHPGLKMLPPWSDSERTAARRPQPASAPSSAETRVSGAGREQRQCVGKTAAAAISVKAEPAAPVSAKQPAHQLEAAAVQRPAAAAPAVEEVVGGAYIGDDGLPCAIACHCRLLYWCRFRTRKGIPSLLAGAGVVPGSGGGAGGGGWSVSSAAAAAAATAAAAARARRCSYALCPQHSSNSRWHLVTTNTNAGGRDWADLIGQTLCSSCFQQFRLKGTLIRARDVTH